MIGVYILKQGSEIVYVGQSIDIERRLSEHKKTDKIYDSVKTIGCKKENLDELEKKIIQKHSPKYNVIHNSNKTNKLYLSMTDNYMMADVTMKNRNGKEVLRIDKVCEKENLAEIMWLLVEGNHELITSDIRATKIILEMVQVHTSGEDKISLIDINSKATYMELR